MKHGSLESGIGGFDYAAEMIGWENVFHCEINSFCQQVLKYYWPHAQSFTDIFEFDGTAWRGKVDIITAGFPCQPFSHAGKRKGSEDDRHIWPENMRIFREAKPKFIVCENVPGLLTIESGLVFERVCADLENEGYETQAFIIPACAKDAVHRRDRVWIVAHSSGINSALSIQQRRQDKTENINADWETPIIANDSNERLEKPGQTGIGKLQEESEGRLHDRLEQRNWDAANTQSVGQQGSRKYRRSGNSKENENRQINRTFDDSELKESWLEAATRLCSVDDGFTGRLDTDSISKSKWRTESLKGYGNTIYWPIALEIFKAIEETNEQLNSI